ncbi:MAG TPA: bifunctional YncE family protein/alkaline phosphatase family protein [Bacteroidales bacterium]|jgi:YVTN family beta-propeller protein|nr:bifunctional YncE family protein/alkaline phosphatase family protein [Bacteroidales bacterium]HOS72548.1 bifunctional YncE family protein/alkaline phosphatase family protein [Bacteroidales bacterium]HQH25069.1 bifunctional YncE family protein/alkaline phosphatase family protein [Bacteroidales bacterium]HQJ82731.1 bifunctional YncE family protein/alkaline phosphatase family protein [Bacteroidales bacterium]
MKTNLNQVLSAFFFLFIISGCGTHEKAGSDIRKVGPQPDGSILVPSNQFLRPAGFQVEIPGRPVDLILTADERFLLVKNKNDLDLIRLIDRTVLQSLPYEKSGASFTGICLSPDGRTVYLTDAQNNICVASLDKNNILKWEDPVHLPGPSFGGYPAPGGVAVNDKGDKLYVTLSRNNSLGIVTLPSKSVSEIPVGIAPYDVIIHSPSKLYVSNWGGRQPEEGEPVYKTSGSDVLIDPETGIANNGAISVVDPEKKIQLKVIEVGLHPSGMALSPDKKLLYVACANSDQISVISTDNDEVIETISVHMLDNIPFGSGPGDLTVSPDGKYLYVANGTENSICVIKTGREAENETEAEIAGSIPVGWYPGSVVLDKAGKTLFVANVKGTGSRNQRTDAKGYSSHDHMGSVSIIKVPDRRELRKMTETVNLNNSYAEMLKKLNPSKKTKKKVPVPEFPDQTSFFRHVVYIIKENRTYDQVFGDMPMGDGDTSLVQFGREITPNHHLLAETFVLLDNFYCSGVLSADGHQWTDEAYVTDYLEKSFGGFTRSYPYDGGDPLAYASSGFIWDNVLRHGLTFRNYGEFVEAVIEPASATFTDIYRDFLEGSNKITIRAKAKLEQLTPYTCPTYIGFPNKVPDVYRAAEFIKELKEFEKNDNFPNFIIMLLPNDHTSGTRPGMPTPQSAVADNDLALGQIVEAISTSKFWKETCILVTEDDPQAGLDHVDGHRTVGLVISPYTRRGEVISTYYSQINMVRTIENILGLPPMNQLDMTAEAMTDCFTGKPDFTPYKAVKNNIPLDNINPPLTSLSGDQLYWAKKSMEQDLDDVDRIDEDTFNRIIWHAVKGYNRPYPVITDRNF